MKQAITVGYSHATPNKPEVISVGGDFTAHTEKVKSLVGKPNEKWARIEVCQLENAREFRFTVPIKTQPKKEK